VHGRRRQLHRAGDVGARHRQPRLVDPEHGSRGVLLPPRRWPARLPTLLLLGPPNQVRLISGSLTAIRHSPASPLATLTWGGLIVALLAWSAFDAHGGTHEPTPGDHLSHGAVVLDSALLVFREGLRRSWMLAAVTASMVGATQVYRRRSRSARRPDSPPASHLGPRRLVCYGQLGAAGSRCRRRRAARGDRPARRHELVLPQGLLDGWIANRNRQKRELVSRAGIDGRRATILGLVALGASPRLPRGLRGRPLPAEPAASPTAHATVLEGVALGLALTAAVGVVTFLAHRHMPYKRNAGA